MSLLNYVRSFLHTLDFFLVLFVPEEKMREVIGKGGETIEGIEKEYGVEVNLEDDGTCTVTQGPKKLDKQYSNLSKISLRISKLVIFTNERL